MQKAKGLVRGLERRGAEAGERLVSIAGWMLPGGCHGGQRGAKRKRYDHAQNRQSCTERVCQAISHSTHGASTVLSQPSKVNANPNFSIDVDGQPDESDPSRGTLGTPSRPGRIPGNTLLATHRIRQRRKRPNFRTP